MKCDISETSNGIANYSFKTSHNTNSENGVNEFWFSNLIGRAVLINSLTKLGLFTVCITSLICQSIQGFYWIFGECLIF